MNESKSILPSIIETIGNTPLVELSRLTKHAAVPDGGTILAKLEYLNPGFSKKDRIANQLIEDAEASGELAPGQTVVELTSGNTGTGLAIVCAVKGYPFVAVMSKGNSEERRKMMSSLGAEVILVDQLEDSIPGQVSGGDLEQVELKTQAVVEERNAFRADQFRLDGNFRAHFLHTGQEIIEQTQGNFDGFCDFVGSGGTFAGCAAAFKQHNSQIQCFVVEPKNAAILSQGSSSEPRHRIQGGGYSKTELKSLNKKHVDGYLTASDEEAIQGARLLAKTEGIFAGFSTGANISAALELLNNQMSGKTIVLTINDCGLKYMSTDLWE